MAYRGTNAVANTVQVWNGTKWIPLNNLALVDSGANSSLQSSGDLAVGATGNVTLTANAGNGALNVSAKNTILSGNLVVNGTTTSVNSEEILIRDRYIDLGNGNTTVAALPGGVMVNVQALQAAVNITAFTAPNLVDVASIPAGLVVGSYFMIAASSVVENNGLFQVLSITGNQITIAGPGVADPWMQTAIAAGTASGTVSPMKVSIIRAGATGSWEQANGSATGLTFQPFSVGNETLQQAYNSSNPATIVVNGTNGPVAISSAVAATDAFVLDTTNTGAALRVRDGGADVLVVDGSGGITGTATANANIALSTSGTGTIDLTSAATLTAIGTTGVLLRAATNTSAAVTVRSGTSNNGTVSSGNVTVQSGDVTTGNFGSGNVTVKTGDTVGTVSPGNLNITGGNSTGAATAGQIQVHAGNASAVGSNGGKLELWAGAVTGAGTGDGGNIDLRAGATVSGNGGDVAILAGTGTTTGGDITLTSGGGTTLGKVLVTTGTGTYQFAQNDLQFKPLGTFNTYLTLSSSGFNVAPDSAASVNNSLSGSGWTTNVGAGCTFTLSPSGFNVQPSAGYNIAISSASGFAMNSGNSSMRLNDIQGLEMATALSAGQKSSITISPTTGDITLTGRDTTSGAGSAVTILAGDATTGTGGNVIIRSGAGATQGKVALQTSAGVNMAVFDPAITNFDTATALQVLRKNGAGTALEYGTVTVKQEQVAEITADPAPSAATLEANDITYACNVNGGAFTVTLPATTAAGTKVRVKDAHNGGTQANVNNITVSSANIDGAASYIIATTYGSATFISRGSGNGWMLV